MKNLVSRRPGIFPAVFFLLSVSLHSSSLAADAPMRIEISNTHPLFVYNCYTNTAPAVDSLWKVIPDDLKPYSAIAFGLCPDDPVPPWSETLALFETMLASAERVGANIICMVSGQGCHLSFATGYLDGLYKKYPRFLGTGSSEHSIGSFYDANNPTYPWPAILDELTAAAKNGGIIYWQDYSFQDWGGWHGRINWSAFPANVLDSMRAHRSNMVFDDKHNSYGGMNLSSTATILGHLQLDLIGAWGCHTEDWDWQSNNVPGYDGKGFPWTAPKAMFGVDFLRTLPFGCTVFSSENAGNVYPYTSIKGPWSFQTLNQPNPPAWKMVIYPLHKKILADSLIPTKDEIFSRIKVAVHCDTVGATQLSHDSLYAGLYAGPQWDWIPRTGRYGMIPILPVNASASELAKFPETIHTSNLPWTTQAEKVAWFNARYPGEPGSSGNTWFYNVRNKWLIANTDVSGQTNSTFNFFLKGNTAIALGGDFSRFTFAIAKELKGVLNIYANNYFLGGELKGQDITTENTYIRKNVFRISGLTSEPAMTLIATKGYNDDNNFSSSSAWDATNRVFTITLNHNGPVDILVNHPDIVGPDAVTARAMPGRAVYTVPPSYRIVTINGRVVMNAMVARGDVRRGGIPGARALGAGMYLLYDGKTMAPLTRIMKVRPDSR